MTGRWIAFEGVDGCGKSTQAARLVEALGALATREPGGTPTAEAIRDLVLTPHLEVTERTEALLMAAARAQLLAELVSPALEAGRTVVSDRSVASSLAYQGYGRGLDVGEIEQVNRWALDGCWPDLFVLIACDQEVLAMRRDAEPDRIERASADFYRRVADGFEALAAADPQRWIRIDGNGDPDEVFGLLEVALEERNISW